MSEDQPDLVGVPYLDFLARLHEQLAPQSYLGIGTHEGRSLASAPPC